MKLPWKRGKIQRMDATIVIQGSEAWCKECGHASHSQAGRCLGCGEEFTRVTTPLLFNAPSVKHYRSDLKWENYD